MCGLLQEIKRFSIISAVVALIAHLLLSELSILNFFAFISGIDDIKGPQRTCDIFIQWLFWTAKLHHPVYIGAAIMKPDLPIFLSSLGFPTFCPAVGKVAYVFSLIYINFSWMSNGLFVSVLLVCYAVSVLAAIRVIGG